MIKYAVVFETLLYDVTSILEVPAFETINEKVEIFDNKEDATKAGNEWRKGFSKYPDGYWMFGDKRSYDIFQVEC